jgi:O-antigen/teichoic acid export membrane protein
MHSPVIEYRTRSVVLFNALSLFASTMVTSILGYVFWWVAAQLYSTTSVGASSALLSALQLAGMFSMVGLGTLLIGEIGRGEHPRHDLLATGLVVSFLTGGLVGAGLTVGVFANLASTAEVVDSILLVAICGLTAALTAALTVLDDALLALARPKWQLFRNVVFSSSKLILLPVGAIAGTAYAARVIIASWAAGLAVSALVVVVLAWRARVAIRGRPRWLLARSLGRAALLHHWINLSQAAPRLVLPLLVTGYLSARLNAEYYVALLLIGFAYVIPSHIATALFAVASGDKGALAREVRGTWRIFMIVCVAAPVGALLVGPLVLRTFGPDYRSAAGPLAILSLATVATGIKSYYTATCRVTGDLARAAWLSVIGSAVEVAACWIALASGADLAGVSWAWVAAMFLEGLLFWPAVAVAGRLSGAPGDKACRLLAWTAPRALAPPEWPSWLP